MPTHTVKQGEHLPKIAEQYKFADYRTIWNHPNNAALKEQRQNPNVLWPGDKVFIPPKEIKKVPSATAKKHRFQLITQKIMLRLAVRDLDSNPIADTPCVLEVDGSSYQLTTDGDGKIEQPIPKNAAGGKLTIGEIEVPIKIGHLDPVEELPGWRARLNNLGYRAGASDDLNDPQLRSAVEEFQCDYDLQVDGESGPQTQGKLKEVHGC